MEPTYLLSDLCGTAEVAQILECPKQQIHALRKRKNFPQAIGNLSATPLWDRREIESFKTTWKRRAPRTKTI